MNTRSDLSSRTAENAVCGNVLYARLFRQIEASFHITPEPIVKQAHLIFGFLEVLLGIVVIASGADSAAITVAFVWVILVAVYMFYVAHRLRSASVLGSSKS